MHDVVIIGAGHNGLVAAAYLARAGADVLVLERRSVVGGACVTETIEGAPGYRVSTGAAQLGNLSPRIVADLDLEAHGFELMLPDPVSVFPQPDGRCLSLWRDTRQTLDEIARFSEADARALPRFRADCGRAATVMEDLFEANSPPSGQDVARAFDAADAGPLHDRFVTGSVRRLMDGYFESEVIKAALGFIGLLGTNGGPDKPGTAYVLLHHLLWGTAGVPGLTGYVRGGMSGLTDALASAARSNGAVIRTGAPVSDIIVRRGKATAVRLGDGTEVRARAIVSNADPSVTFLDLLPRECLPGGFADAVERRQTNGVALKVNCALRRLPRFTAVPEGLTPPRVTICPSLDYAREAWGHAERGGFSPAPFMTVHMQSALDPSLAPPGHHTLTCYAHYFPYALSDGDWDSNREAAGRTVLDTLERYAPGIRESLIATEVHTPLDIERRFAMTGGHQFHGEMLPGALFDERPVAGARGPTTPVESLFLCGAGTHPGGCVSGAPGKAAAHAVERGLKPAPESH